MAEQGVAPEKLEDGNVSAVEEMNTPSTSNDQSRHGSADSPDEKSNVTNIKAEPDKSSTSVDKSASAGMRISSSKFASLKAAFEQSPAVDRSPITARRAVTGSEKVNDTPSEYKQEYLSELERLKEELAKGKGIQIALEEKVAGLEEELTSRSAAPVIEDKQAELDRAEDLRAALEAEVADLKSGEAKNAQLKDELNKERELRIAFEEKVTGLEENVEDLHAALEERDEQWRSEFEKRSAQLVADAEGRLSLVMDEAKKRQGEAAYAQKQLTDLKQSIAASTRSTEVSDTTFREDVALLQYEVQNWVINNFRRVKGEMSPVRLCERLERVAEPKQLECLKPIYEQFDSAARLPIFQATVACYLMEIFDDPYLFGLQGQGDWARRSRQAADALQDVFDPETYNRWRVLTFDTLRQSASIKEPVDNAAGGIAEMICITLKALTDAEDNESWQSSLKPIILRAISIAHLIRVQHAQYHFYLPSSGQPLNAKLMEDVAEVGESDGESIIRCATFPGITKLGKEGDDAAEGQQVVVKAKVVCVGTDEEEP